MSSSVLYYSTLKGIKNLSISKQPTITQKKTATVPTAKTTATTIKPTATTVKPTNPTKSTLYWAINLDLKQVLESVEHVFETSPQLVPNKEVHTTLLFVGRKENSNEQELLVHKDKQCTIIVDAYGLSNDALCLRVSSMVFSDTKEPVPSFQTVTQHVTVALAKGVKAVDSVKALNNMTVGFVSPVTFNGVLKQYFF